MQPLKSGCISFLQRGEGTGRLRLQMQLAFGTVGRLFCRRGIFLGLPRLLQRRFGAVSRLFCRRGGSLGEPRLLFCSTVTASAGCGCSLVDRSAAQCWLAAAAAAPFCSQFVHAVEAYLPLAGVLYTGMAVQCSI